MKITLSSLFALVLFTGGCSDHSSSTDPPGDAGLGCSPIPAPNPPFSSPAKGTISGPNLQATVCPGGVTAVVETTPHGSAPYSFVLNHATWTTTSQADFVFQSPPSANQGQTLLLVGLPSLDPATYASPGNQECGYGFFTYYLPIPPGLDCGGGTDSTCPAGCSHACSAMGCDPCTPQQPSVSFAVSGAEDCLGKPTAVQGSWMLTLTSVELAGTNGLTYYTPHGTLTASLMAADGSGGPTQLSLSF